MLSIFKKSNRVYDRVERIFNSADNSGVMQDRKSVVTKAESLGYLGDVFIYPKARVRETHIGYIPATGWVVRELVEDYNTGDGFVICTRA